MRLPRRSPPPPPPPFNTHPGKRCFRAAWCTYSYRAEVRLSRRPTTSPHTSGVIRARMSYSNTERSRVVRVCILLRSTFKAELLATSRSEESSQSRTSRCISVTICPEKTRPGIATATCAHELLAPE